MKQRLTTAVIAIAIMIPFLIFSRSPAFLVLVTFLSVCAAYELLGCVGLRGNILVCIPTYILSLSAIITTRYPVMDAANFFMELLFQLFIYIIFLFSVVVFSKNKIKFGDAAVLTIMMIYVLFGFASLVRLRDVAYHGTFIFFLALIFPWVSDSFAYFCGRFFGKHKLIPEVSPKKTVEGAVGAIICTCICSVFYGIICDCFFHVHVNYVTLSIMGLLISLIAQCGDLIASVVKRSYGIKDYGFLLPGHGGVLDRFDSTIATTSVVYIFCLMFPFFEQSL